MLFTVKIIQKKQEKKISEKAKNRKISENIKLKISTSLKGDKNYWYGKKLSEEHKLKLSNKAKRRTYTESQKNNIRKNSPKKIELIRILNGITYSYYSFREAEMMTGIERRYIKNHLKELGFEIKKASV